ncbi:hypothetical protein COU56_01345 [Candidatus Pacearchaeota archaeon CG10_big_fil_rev_8_21_14_0_10_31_9]|nr:MAG: hypothetical protein AUJ62_02350 [Candidatus Pacearchaeota archaeon CG1_02_32_21]PIN95521.1 MAG: hypothetical protein COU56_01345 [Candidatus Pacearchaeota archaeon CG10_big_fil_rev_8_21_14_0_10_31_9]
MKHLNDITVDKRLDLYLSTFLTQEDVPTMILKSEKKSEKYSMEEREVNEEADPFEISRYGI